MAAIDLYTRGAIKRVLQPTRIITLPGGMYAVAGVKGLYSKAEAERIAAKLDGEA
jgi:hypothetical protein